MKLLTVALCISCLSLAAACEEPTPTAAEAQPTGGAAAEPPGEASAKPAADPAPNAEKVPVTKTTFDAARFASEKPQGKALGGFAFTDSAGENAVMFSRVDTESTDAATTVLHIKHVATSDGATKVVREYKEVISDCDADTVLEPKFGDWSVTDLDDDGIGEATFAYTADCTSDVSPLKHKVLLTEGGEKFALRGHSQVKPGLDDEVLGGDFKADEMEANFLKHATTVWNDTSKGFGFEK